jgi:hypothetical protein
MSTVKPLIEVKKLLETITVINDSLTKKYFIEGVFLMLFHTSYLSQVRCLSTGHVTYYSLQRSEVIRLMNSCLSKAYPFRVFCAVYALDKTLSYYDYQVSSEELSNQLLIDLYELVDNPKGPASGRMTLASAYKSPKNLKKYRKACSLSLQGKVHTYGLGRPYFVVGAEKIRVNDIYNSLIEILDLTAKEINILNPYSIVAKAYGSMYNQDTIHDTISLRSPSPLEEETFKFERVNFRHDVREKVKDIQENRLSTAQQIIFKRTRKDFL